MKLSFSRFCHSWHNFLVIYIVFFRNEKEDDNFAEVIREVVAANRRPEEEVMIITPSSVEGVQAVMTREEHNWASTVLAPIIGSIEGNVATCPYSWSMALHGSYVKGPKNGQDTGGSHAPWANWE
jgi:hypothetical protein